MDIQFESHKERTMRAAQPGTQYHAPQVDAVRQRALRIIKGTATFEDRFVADHKELVDLLETLRSMGCVIVFVTGVWDLIHIGHADYIWRGRQEAAKLYPQADHLIVVVGADSDAFTKRRKGEERPIVPEGERVRILSHLRAVDVVTLQYEADQLFRIVPHEVRITSQSTADLPALEVIQAQCEHVVNLPPQAETSTTARIRRLSIDGSAAMILKIEQKLSTMLKEIRDDISK
jgi:D-glycero-beta-D-manno-heptose 1-phosphate adenylyltransferase